MTIKRVILVTGSNSTKKALVKQITSTLENIQVEAVAVDEEWERVEPLFSAASKEEDLFLFSSQQILRDLQEHAIDFSQYLWYQCQRSVALEQIEKVICLEKDTKVLFVNDLKETTESSIRNLLEYGLDHVEYIPWYPGIEETKAQKQCKIALAVGERDLVPRYIEQCIDLGPRVIAIQSMLKLAELTGRLEKASVSRIVNSYFSKITQVARKMVSLNREKERIEGLLKEKHGAKGHLASYTFEHILGNSEVMWEVKQRGERLAKTDLTILIEGESGTGKELFASAIHNASKRRKGPFIAVNFSALPDDLVESELFGYEEGAFTGAKKGGQIGLFEQANGGTIFLDEIGDITSKMQAKLLRVLQEKEIMALGGGTIKKVDVRVIAATNKDLKHLVEQNLFRNDLYYRLKIGYLYIPPLRCRLEDVPELAQYFAKGEQGKTVEVAPEVLTVLKNYNWYGNVRELSNTIKYMLAVRNREDRLVLEDMPDDNFFEIGPERKEEAVVLDMEQLDVLECVWELKKEGRQIGRKIVTEEMIRRGKMMTENRVRTLLSQLEARGYLIIKRGRQGIGLTQDGQRVAADHWKRNENGEKW